MELVKVIVTLGEVQENSRQVLKHTENIVSKLALIFLVLYDLNGKNQDKIIFKEKIYFPNDILCLMTDLVLFITQRCPKTTNT